jgi:protein-tyrosine phosphatase
MIDLHAHILPAVDDGPTTVEEALAVLRAAADDGIEVIAATPHVRDDYPTTPEAMERAIAELRRPLERAGIPIRLVRGGEIALERLHLLTDEDLRRFTLGGGGRYLLVETPYVGWPLDLAQRLFPLQLSGFTPVIAHPERNVDVQSRPELLRPLVERGVLVQVTAASLDGRLGRSSARAARGLVAAGLAHLIASDAHAPRVRGAGLSSAASVLGDNRLARWLVHDVPLAIIGGSDLPHRPAPAVRHRRFALAKRTHEDHERA